MKKYKITACVNGVKKSRIVKVKNEVDAYLIARGLSAVIDEDIDMFNELLADSKSTQKAIDFCVIEGLENRQRLKSEVQEDDR